MAKGDGRPISFKREEIQGRIGTMQGNAVRKRERA